MQDLFFNCAWDILIRLRLLHGLFMILNFQIRHFLLWLLRGLSAFIHILHIINHEVNQFSLSLIFSFLTHLHNDTTGVTSWLRIIPHEALYFISGWSWNLRWYHFVSATVLRKNSWSQLSSISSTTAFIDVLLSGPGLLLPGHSFWSESHVRLNWNLPLIILFLRLVSTVTGKELSRLLSIFVP
jgi:hypothetical protein